MTGVQFLERAIMRFSIFATMFRPSLGAQPASCEIGSGSSYFGGKWQGHEADHSLPSSAKVKNVWNSISTPPWQGA